MTRTAIHTSLARIRDFYVMSGEHEIDKKWKKKNNEYFRESIFIDQMRNSLLEQTEEHSVLLFNARVLEGADDEEIPENVTEKLMQ